MLSIEADLLVDTHTAQQTICGQTFSVALCLCGPKKHH